MEIPLSVKNAGAKAKNPTVNVISGAAFIIAAGFWGAMWGLGFEPRPLSLIIRFTPIWLAVLAYMAMVEERTPDSIGLTPTRWGWALLLFALHPQSLARLVQAGAEELFFRGWLLHRLNEQFGRAVGVVVSTLIFVAMHAINSNFNPLVAVQTLVFGAVLSWYVLQNNEIWGVIAIHTVWNLYYDISG